MAGWWLHRQEGTLDLIGKLAETGEKSGVSKGIIALDPAGRGRINILCVYEMPTEALFD